MMFSITLYQTKSENNDVNKVLEHHRTYDGALRSTSSIINPTVTIAAEIPVEYNYCYIPEFKRFYFIKDITIIRTGLFELSLEVDVLMSNRESLYKLNGLVVRQEFEGDDYIADDTIITTTGQIIETKLFPDSKFTDDLNYIVTVVGSNYNPEPPPAQTTKEEIVL